MSESEIALFELLRAGLWEKKSQFSECDDIDYQDVYRIAVEQSVVGLIAIGLEYVSVIVPHQWAMAFAGSALQIERRNKAMNSFVVELIERLNEDGIYSLLIKGQGIAQCYKRPLWRTCGDIDLFLSEDNYIKAKKRKVFQLYLKR